MMIGKLSGSMSLRRVKKGLLHPKLAARFLANRFGNMLLEQTFDDSGMPLWMKISHNGWRNQWHKYDFGHYANIAVPELVEVPWFELPVDSRREIKPETPVTDEFDTRSIEDKLEALVILPEERVYDN